VCQNALDDIGGNNLVAECSHATDFTSSNYFMAASCELPGMQMLLQSSPPASWTVSFHACAFHARTLVGDWTMGMPLALLEADTVW